MEELESVPSLRSLDKSFLSFSYIRKCLFQAEFDELLAYDWILEEIVRF